MAVKAAKKPKKGKQLDTSGVFSQSFNFPLEVELSAFRRSEKFEDALLGIGIFLMRVIAGGMSVFLVLTVLAGVTLGFLPETPGRQALSDLFVDVAHNAKPVSIFVLGIFFSKYIPGLHRK